MNEEVLNCVDCYMCVVTSTMNDLYQYYELVTTNVRNWVYLPNP
jgi:hypothetical protein